MGYRRHDRIPRCSTHARTSPYVRTYVRTTLHVLTAVEDKQCQNRMDENLKTQDNGITIESFGAGPMYVRKSQRIGSEGGNDPTAGPCASHVCF